MITLSDLFDAQEALRLADNEHEKRRTILRQKRNELLIDLRKQGMTKLHLAGALCVSVPHVGVLLKKAGAE